MAYVKLYTCSNLTGLKFKHERLESFVFNKVDFQPIIHLLMIKIRHACTHTADIHACSKCPGTSDTGPSKIGTQFNIK